MNSVICQVAVLTKSCGTSSVHYSQEVDFFRQLFFLIAFLSKADMKEKQNGDKEAKKGKE